MRGIRSIKNTEWVDLLITYINKRIGEDDLESLLDMGLNTDAIQTFRRLRQVDVKRVVDRYCQKQDKIGLNLENGTFKLEMDFDALVRLIDYVNSECLNEGILDDLLQAGAPCPMINHFFGFHAPHYAQRRKLFGLEGEGRGRCKEPDPEVTERVWRALKKLIGARDPDAVRPEEMLRLHQELGESIGLRVIWKVFSTLERSPQLNKRSSLSESARRTSTIQLYRSTGESEYTFPDRRKAPDS